MRKQLLWGVGLAVALVVPAVAAGPQATGPQHKVVMPEKLTWGPPPPGLPSGAHVAVIDGDPTRPGFFVLRIRAPDGYTIRPHWHSQDERITVLSGKVEMSVGDELGKNVTSAGPGGYFLMPGLHHHAAVMRGNETVIQLDGLGPFDIFYVNPTDDPRTKRSSR